MEAVEAWKAFFFRKNLEKNSSGKTFEKYPSNPSKVTKKKRRKRFCDVFLCSDMPRKTQKKVVEG
jgi:hypothetical protein